MTRAWTEWGSRPGEQGADLSDVSEVRSLVLDIGLGGRPGWHAGP